MKDRQKGGKESQRRKTEPEDIRNNIHSKATHCQENKNMGNSTADR